LLPSRIRHLARGQAILGRARPMQKIEILARERPLLFGVSSGMVSSLLDLSSCHYSSH
jgi:hypothetical protein